MNVISFMVLFVEMFSVPVFDSFRRVRWLYEMHTAVGGLSRFRVGPCVGSLSRERLLLPSQGSLLSYVMV
jgi:hypothetical protein